MAPAKAKTGKTRAKAQPSGIIEIDLDNVEESTAYDGDDPTRGFYTFRLVSVAAHESQNGNEGIRWMFALTDNPLYDGWVRSVYSNLDSTKWKTEEIMLALAGGKKKVGGTKKAKVRLNLNNDKELAKYVAAAELVRGRVQRRKDSDPDDPEMELGKIIPLDPEKQAARRAAETEADDDFEDADEFEDADDEDEADEDEDDDTEDDDEDDEDSDDDEEDDDEDEEDDEDEDDDEDEEEDEVEETPPPAKKSKAASKKATEKPASKKASAKVTNIKDAKSAKGKKAKK